MSFTFERYLGLLVAAFGLAYIVGHAKISLVFRILLGGQLGDLPTQFSPPPRPKVEPLIPVVGPWIVSLLECPACFGFWEGFVFGLLCGKDFFECLLFGFAVAGSNFALGRFTGLI